MEGFGGDVIMDPEVGLAVREPRATSIVEATELLVMEGSNAVVAVDVMVVGIVVAIAAVVGHVNYAFFLSD